MTKTYLVTGGTGFIGSALVKRLVKDGHKVRILDDNSRGRSHRIADVIDAVEFFETDIRNYDSVLKATDGVDSVLHLAYVNGTEFFYSKPKLVLDIAIRGMMNVVDACIETGVKDLVLASSSEVYQTPPIIPTAEDAPLSIPDITNPRYSYGGGKILCELMVMCYGDEFDRATIFRPHNVYGPDMGFEHVVPQLLVKIDNLVKENPDSNTITLPIRGDGSQTRAFTYIDDFTDGLIQIIDSGKHKEVYHIGNNEEVTIKDIIEMIASHYGKQVIIESGPIPKGETARRCPDITKMKELGHNPTISLDDGIGKVINWYRSTK
jgi:dTDP-glucose 4,6-dehydratase/UDP-glucose 4-epimerase